jgi:predicted N-acyltransferase
VRDPDLGEAVARFIAAEAEEVAAEARLYDEHSPFRAANEPP